MEAASQSKISLMFLGVLVLAIVIIFLDLFIWKPISHWSRRFTYSVSPGEEETKEVWDVVIIFWEAIGKLLKFILKFIQKIRLKPVLSFKFIKRFWQRRISNIVRKALLVILIGFVLFVIVNIAKAIPSIILKLKLSDFLISFKALLYSFLRILISYIIAFSWTFPTAIFLFRHPRAARFISPIIQILPSIPAIAFFPLILYFLLPFKNGMNMAAIIVILSGMQWYLLFTIYGGLKAIPEDLQEFTESFGVKGMSRLKRLLLPAALPSIMTGTITAVGGAWNALVVAEYTTLGNKAVSVTGIGSILNTSIASNNQSLFIVSLFIMVAAVFSMNHFVYRPLYDKILDRYRMES